MISYVNFGCGLDVSDKFINYDSSPSLYLLRLPLIGPIIRKKLPPFPKIARPGNIVKGLPVGNETLNGIYSSHVLEHLSYNDCIQALRNCYSYLKPGGVFRAVLPDFEGFVNNYIEAKRQGNYAAANEFLTYSSLGKENTFKSFFSFIKEYFSGANHLWMWDFESLSHELGKVGFKDITRSYYHQSRDPYFNHVEVEIRFDYALCIEAVK